MLLGSSLQAKYNGGLDTQGSAAAEQWRTHAALHCACVMDTEGNRIVIAAQTERF
jgi:hypothetical protein